MNFINLGSYSTCFLNLKSQMYVLKVKGSQTCFPRIQSYSNGGPDTNLEIPSFYQKQVLVGLILGDECLRNPNASKRSTGNYRLEVTLAHKVKPFVYWLKNEILKNLCTQTPPTPYPANNPDQYWFATKAHPFFTEWAALCYNHREHESRVKVLPPYSFLETWFTEVSLARWIMGDGYWSEKRVYICTECFTLENVLLWKKYTCSKNF
jgi:hypothetical protein